MARWDIFPIHLADILDTAVETKNEHRLVEGSIDKISMKVMKNLHLKQTMCYKPSNNEDLRRSAREELQGLCYFFLHND